VQVSKEKAYFFKSKKYLSSQEILEEYDDGSLLIQYTVTQEKETEDLIKRWLPHIKIFEPISLRKSIENELKQYLGV